MTIVHDTRPRWQQRVVEERRVLEQRLIKLRAFLNGVQEGAIPFGSFETDDRTLLWEQKQTMEKYSRILQARISRWRK